MTRFSGRKFAHVVVNALENRLPRRNTALAALPPAIITGAAIGLACTWWILPVRSIDVLRHRLADALAAFAMALGSEKSMRSADPLTEALTRVEELAPAFRALQRISPRSLVAHAADWANTLLACGADAAALIESGTAPGEVRRA